jgi:hypothetical protein
VARLSEAGEVKIVCNRYVLREGVDWPWLEHGILATIFGQLTAYLQTCGRILRQYYIDGVPQLDRVTIQDHGGNWWRHGSCNSDRDFDLNHDDHFVGEVREERMRNKKEPEPIHCPRCHAIRLSGSVCPRCNYTHTARSRMVVQANGKLKEMHGDILKPRRIYAKPDGVAKWERCYWRAHNSGKTFSEARGLFCMENNYAWPSPDWPLMPVNEADLFSKVKDVPKAQLVSKLRPAVEEGVW